MNRKKSIDRISELFSRFQAEVETLNSNNLYDINIHSETVIIPLLNIVYNLKLINANVEDKNAAGIDLIDKENKISIQVTSDSKSDKVIHSIEEFIKYEREKEYDILFMYILTKRQKKYTSKKIKELTNGVIEFNPEIHIIDFRNIVKEINSWISLDKINRVRELLENEFTEEKIEFRKKIATSKTSEINEILYPNIIEIGMPEKIYLSNVSIDRDTIIKKSWETTYKLKRSASNRKVILKGLEQAGVMPIYDWHIHSNTLISIYNPSTSVLSQFVETGSPTEISVVDYCNRGLTEVNEFKKFLNIIISNDLYFKGIKWIDKERVYRFSVLQKIAQERKISWKLKNRATRSVVSEIWNSEKNQISAFKHLAFKGNPIYSNEKWYFTIIPTWTFTWNGFQKSFNHSKLLTGIKNLENNQSVYNSFRFISYCLTNVIDDEIEGKKYLKFGAPIELPLKYVV